MAVLKAWRTFKGDPGDDEPMVTDSDVAPDRGRLAVTLREDLKVAGVTRAILFEDEAPNDEPLRFHVLRSSSCTLARRTGKSDAWISERTGHELSGDMINRYDRGAQTLADLAYAPFPDITHAIPGPCHIVDRLTTRLATSGSLRSDLSAPRKIRTSDNWFRRPVLYPAELWAPVPVGRRRARDDTRGSLRVNGHDMAPERSREAPQLQFSSRSVSYTAKVSHRATNYDRDAPARPTWNWRFAENLLAGPSWPPAERVGTQTAQG